GRRDEILWGGGRKRERRSLRGVAISLVPQIQLWRGGFLRGVEDWDRVTRGAVQPRTAVGATTDPSAPLKSAPVGMTSFDGGAKEIGGAACGGRGEELGGADAIEERRVSGGRGVWGLRGARGSGGAVRWRVQPRSPR